MTRQEAIEEAFKEAMKKQDKVRITALRLLRTALKNRSVEKRGPLDDGEVVAVLRGLIRQGQDAVRQFEEGGRMDLADKERGELEVLSGFLPPAASPQEVEETIERVIRETQAGGMKDMGKVMKAVMAALSGRADGQTIQARVKEKLSSLT
jgi:uncharacterized protein YqeY